MTEKPRVLMILHMPWRKELGGSRVQLELAEEYRKMGFQVDKFDYNDAFPNPPKSRWTSLFTPSFSKKAKEFVLKQKDNYDIIDAHQGNLPFTKEELGFSGLYIVRSVGLYALYDEFNLYADKRWPDKNIKSLIWKIFSFGKRRKERNYCYKSFQTCDGVIVCNEDEKLYLEQKMKLRKPVFNIPFGLAEDQIERYHKCKTDTIERWKNKQIAFIGNWSVRKGSLDWPDIVKMVKKGCPEARFLFLGTGLDEVSIKKELGVDVDADDIEIVAKYQSSELPNLIKDATVGAFPSYIEGFPFAILEKLSGGLPTVAYDVPGPRETLKNIDNTLLIPIGDVEKFSKKIIDLLNIDYRTYELLVEKCLMEVECLSWKSIAVKQVEIYKEVESSLNRKNE